jgi:hypothetical protein
VLRTGTQVIVLGEIDVAEVDGKETLIIQASTPKVRDPLYLA